MTKEALIAIVSAAQKGDGDALNTLFQVYYNDVYYFALKTVKDSDLACDITQETFLEIFNTIGQLQEPAAFVAWMKRIAYHQCTRYFKKKKDVLVDETEDGATVFDTLEETNEDFIPAEALDKDDFRKTILAMIDELSEEQRAAVMMYYFDELSVKQIAEMQGVSEGTVKSRLNYARKAIKASVEDYEKKHNIKLHALPFFPFMGWLFTGEKALIGLPQATAEAMAANLSTVSASAAAHAASTVAAGSLAAEGTSTVATGVSSAANAMAGDIAGLAANTASSSSAAATTATSAGALTAEGTATTAQGVSAAANAVAGNVANVAAAGGTATTASTAAGTTAGTGATVAAVATKAAIPLAAKIAAGVAAVAVTVTGTVGVVMMTSDNTKKSGTDDEEETAVTTTIDDEDNSSANSGHDIPDNVQDILGSCGYYNPEATSDGSATQNSDGSFTITSDAEWDGYSIADGAILYPHLLNVDLTKYPHMRLKVSCDVPFRMTMQTDNPLFSDWFVLMYDGVVGFFPKGHDFLSAMMQVNYSPAGEYDCYGSWYDTYQACASMIGTSYFDVSSISIENVRVELLGKGTMTIEYMYMCDIENEPEKPPFYEEEEEQVPDVPVVEEQTAENQQYTSENLQPYGAQYRWKDTAIIAYNDYIQNFITQDGAFGNYYNPDDELIPQFDDPASVTFIPASDAYIYRDANGDRVDQYGNILNDLGDVILCNGHSMLLEEQDFYLSVDTSTGRFIAFDEGQIVPLVLHDPVNDIDYEAAEELIPCKTGYGGQHFIVVIGGEHYYYRYDRPTLAGDLPRMILVRFADLVDQVWDSVYSSTATPCPLVSYQNDTSTLRSLDSYGKEIVITLPDGYTTADIKQAFHRPTPSDYYIPTCQVLIMFNDGSVYYLHERDSSYWYHSIALSQLGADGKLLEFRDIFFSNAAGGYSDEILVLMDDNVWYKVTKF